MPREKETNTKPEGVLMSEKEETQPSKTVKALLKFLKPKKKGEEEKSTS